MELVDNLIKKIDSLELVSDIRKLNSMIRNDSNLMKLLDEYKYNKSDDLKEKIISNDLFSKYKDKECEVNLLIMGINQKLSSINNRRSCIKWL